MSSVSANATAQKSGDVPPPVEGTCRIVPLVQGLAKDKCQKKVVREIEGGRENVFEGLKARPGEKPEGFFFFFLLWFLKIRNVLDVSLSVSQQADSPAAHRCMEPPTDQYTASSPLRVSPLSKDS